ncbi:MAG: hypothetical protein FRX49_03523, partial [Trebouxia sp. A1-2]
MHTAAAYDKLGPQQLCGRAPRRTDHFARCSRTRLERQRPFSLKQQRRSRISAANELLSVGFYTAAAAGLLYSATPLLTGKSKDENQGRSDNYGETDADPEGIKWGVMSVVSFIPLFNWTAWVFAAIDDETQAAKYYAFAAVYALPLIRNGFQFDSFLAVAVLLCAAHVQLERIANTEPVGIDVPAVSDISRASAKGARQLTDSTKEWSASVQETSRRRQQEKQELEDMNTDKYRRQLSADELAKWDARLNSKDEQA